MSEKIDTPLVQAAWHHARDQRQLAPGLLLHSDRGVQYASAAFRADLSAVGAVQSMSRRGNCYDNAMMESGWGSLKVECVYRHRFPHPRRGPGRHLLLSALLQPAAAPQRPRLSFPCGL